MRVASGCKIDLNAWKHVWQTFLWPKVTHCFSKVDLQTCFVAFWWLMRALPGSSGKHIMLQGLKENYQLPGIPRNRQRLKKRLKPKAFLVPLLEAQWLSMTPAQLHEAFCHLRNLHSSLLLAKQDFFLSMYLYKIWDVWFRTLIRLESLETLPTLSSSCSHIQQSGLRILWFPAKRSNLTL